MTCIGMRTLSISARLDGLTVLNDLRALPHGSPFALDLGAIKNTPASAAVTVAFGVTAAAKAAPALAPVTTLILPGDPDDAAVLSASHWDEPYQRQIEMIGPRALSYDQGVAVVPIATDETLDMWSEKSLHLLMGGAETPNRLAAGTWQFATAISNLIIDSTFDQPIFAATTMNAHFFQLAMVASVVPNAAQVLSESEDGAWRATSAQELTRAIGDVLRMGAHVFMFSAGRGIRGTGSNLRAMSAAPGEFGIAMTIRTPAG